LAMGLHSTRELLANAIAPARAMLSDVEVQVVGVKRVGARTQDGREPAASRRPHGAEIGGFVRAGLPLDQDPTVVRERDRNEIDRQPTAMGANLRAGDAVLRPAGVAGSGFYSRDLGVEHRLAKRRDNQADIVGEREREFAGEKRAVRQTHNVAA
jgi:hypothetical protein